VSVSLFFSCQIDATDSNYANNLEFEFYDNTNSAVLYAGLSADLEILKTQGKFTAPVHLEDTTASIEVRIKINDTDTTAYTVYFDDFKFGPAAQVQTVYRKSTTLALDNDFTAGSIRIERIGNTVSIQSTGTITHASSSNPQTSASFLPDWATPAETALNTCRSLVTHYDCYVQANGLLGVVRRTASLTASTGTSIDFASITYTVPDTAGPTLTENELSLQTVRVSGEGNGGTALTANTTDLDFTEISDTHGTWNGSQFTAPASGPYRATGIAKYTASINPVIYAYIDGVQEKFAGSAASSSTCQFKWSGTLEAGQTLSFRQSVGGTLDNNSTFHWIEISSAPDYTFLGVVKNNEYLEANLVRTASGIPTAATWADMLEIPLTPGTWDLELTAVWTKASASTVVFGISDTSGNVDPGDHGVDKVEKGSTPSSAVGEAGSMTKKNIVVTQPTTYYAKFYRNNAAVTTWGGKFSARRVK
jgi:hypothetical protein